VLFFSVVLVSDFFSTFTTLACFGWLLLIPSGCIDMLVFLCTSLAYEITLCGPLKGPGHLFVQFSLFVNILTLFWFVLGLLFDSPPIFLL
jgi:hypothetical protein